LNVLVVEDDEDMRFLLHELLPLQAPIGAMRFAPDGDVAATIIADFPPDVVILDSRMAGPAAARTASLIRAAHPHARLISFSGMPAGVGEWADAVVPKGANGIQELGRVLKVVGDPGTGNSTVHR
jgi:chemotaxis response regulator CheB